MPTKVKALKPHRFILQPGDIVKSKIPPHGDSFTAARQIIDLLDRELPGDSAAQHSAFMMAAITRFPGAFRVVSS